MYIHIPCVTVIVPVYNVEKYLHRCVDSIICQTYRNLEIILVDDGSTDSSPSICDEYAEKDCRIKVFHKENGGVSSARNLGLKNATGEYLTFVDSDDYILSTCIEKMVRGMEENDVDMVIVGWQDENGCKGGVSENFEEGFYKVFNQDDSIKASYVSSVWGKLFIRENLTTKSFDEKIFYAEDSLFICKNFLAHEEYKFLIIGAPYYIYDKSNEASATRYISFNEKMLSGIDAYNQMIECIHSDEIKEAINWGQVGFLYRIYFLAKEENNKKLYGDIIKKIKNDIIALRRKGYHPLDKKENFVEILYLYFYSAMRCYLKIRKWLSEK